MQKDIGSMRCEVRKIIGTEPNQRISQIAWLTKARSSIRIRLSLMVPRESMRSDRQDQVGWRKEKSKKHQTTVYRGQSLPQMPDSVQDDAEKTKATST